MKKIWLYVVLCLVFCANLTKAVETNNQAEEFNYKKIATQLSEIENLIKSSDVDIRVLEEKSSYMNVVFSELNSYRHKVEEEVKIIEKRIEALGVTDENIKEAKSITLKRNEFNKEFTTEKARLAEIDVLIASVEELNKKIFNIRNQMLWGNLLKTDLRFINPAVLWKVNTNLTNLFWDIVKTPLAIYDEYKEGEHQGFGVALLKFLSLLTIIAFIGYYLRKLVIKYWGYGRNIENLRLGHKISASFAVWCAYGIIPLVIILYFWYNLNQIAFWSDDLFKLVLQTSLHYILFVIMGRATARVILTPYNPKWRLLKMSTVKAKKLFRAINFTIYIVGFFSILLKIVSELNYSFELLSYLMALSATLKAICMVWLFHIYFTCVDKSNLDNEAVLKNKISNIGLLVSLFAVVIIGLAFCGYPRLAYFIINQTLLSLAAIMLYTIIRRFVFDLVRRLLFMGLWIKTFHFRRVFLRKIDFWFGIIIEPLMTLLLIVGLLILWGVPSNLLQNFAYKAISGFTIGGITVSLLSIFWGIVTFVVCLWVIRFLQDRIEFKLLEKTSIDNGTKHSLASGFAYIGYCLSGLLAIAIMGGNLTNIALIAGALSVGIGLGLQDIVNNFVSGIVMLFERPIKVGDWVIVNGEEGCVKQINIRSTEIETFNKSSVIIPNATVLSNAVKNLTHQNNLARFDIAVNVPYGTNAKRVKEILLECATKHPRIAKKPEPYVLFQNFGNTCLEFELRFYVSSIWTGWEAPSDMRYIISEYFEKEGIDKPFEHLVIHQTNEKNKG